MFKAVLIICLWGLASSRPQDPAVANGTVANVGGHSSSQNVTFVKDERTPLDEKGSYKYDIELTDGTKFSQEGNTEAPGPGENETSIVIKGSYSYVAPDGTPVNVMYIADKDGYQPTGNVIPTASNATFHGITAVNGTDSADGGGSGSNPESATGSNPPFGSNSTSSSNPSSGTPGTNANSTGSTGIAGSNATGSNISGSNSTEGSTSNASGSTTVGPPAAAGYGAAAPSAPTV